MIQPIPCASGYLLFSTKGGGPVPATHGGETLVYKTWRPLTGSPFPEKWFSLQKNKVMLALVILRVHILQLLYWPRKKSCCELYLAYHAGRLVHYCFLMPPFFRIPLMRPGDFEIGPYWTNPQYRGRGITTHTVGIIKAAHPDATLYILMRRDNEASIKVAEKTLLRSKPNARGKIVFCLCNM